LEGTLHKRRRPASLLVSEAARDGLHRLLSPSIENETLAAARERAEEKAIEVFCRQSAPASPGPAPGAKSASWHLDPGFRTGCKLVVLDRMGQLQKSDVIYPHEPHNRTREAAAKVQELCDLYGVEVIVVGNGTAGRETEAFLQNMALRARFR